ncbi:tRNA pseudouridine(38-40) synthase TruA [Cyclobacterium amurskyense]|uniref:tRNA pseudouridine synthase A n=2 Tax=Cyclobacterium amurskyense TaxID=320787 RepID=A0A0H4PBG7_9BACT|nr:tRNA pseudouridine synthase A [Cyclobacterium amurskyense]
MTKKLGYLNFRKEYSKSNLKLGYIFIFAVEMNESPRYFIELSYDGKNYHGWQKQTNAISVQEELEKALSILFRQPISIMGSGRTDAGVHALQQFAHFDYELELTREYFIKRINGLLPPDIAVFDIFPVNKKAHARFDATFRRYEYHITFRKDPFIMGKAWHCYYDLDLEAMASAASLLLGRQDFECFSRRKTNVKTFECEINNAYWEQTSNGLVFHIQANRFLRGMVRAIVGTLVKVGRGQLDSAGVTEIIANKDRNLAGTSAPPQGLFLSKVNYTDRIYK